MTKETLVAGLNKIAQKHTLKIERVEDRPREIYYELAWIPRDVTSEEEIFGVTEARNRIIMHGRMAGTKSLGHTAEMYRVTWELHNEVASVTNPSWHIGRIPESVRERFRPVFSDLAMEIRTGLNR